jgi:AsmA protein
MKAFGKILGLIILGLLLIIVALGFALTHFFDPNDYKDEIRNLVRNKAHVELTLNGDIGWSLFPWLGLELHDASVATLAAPDKPFADLKMLGLSVRVLPLLRKEVQMSDVRVEGLNLMLTRDESGHGNWDDIGKIPAAAANPAQPPVAGDPAAKPDKSWQPLKLDIDSLTVNNARIEFNDIPRARQFIAESIQLSTGPIHNATDIPVKLTAFLSTNQPVIRTKTELAGKLRFDRALKRYQFDDMRLSGEATGDPLQGKTVTFSAQGQLLADMTANVADWTNLKFSANQLRALGELHIRDLDKTPQLSGGLSIAQLNLREFLDNAGQPAPLLGEGSLTKFEAVTRISASPTSVALEDMTVKLDDSTLTGRVAIDDFAKQSLRLQLKADTFNVDRYRAPQSEEDKSAGAARKSEVQGNEAQALAASGTSPLPGQPTQGAWSNARLLPLERLRTLDVEAELSAGKLTVQKLAIQNAALKTSALDGAIKVDSLRGDLYNGNFEVKGNLDARPEVPLASVQTHIVRVPVERFIESQGTAPPLRGLLTLTSDLSGKGNSQKALVDSLNGTASFALNDGVLVNANLEQQLCRGISTLNRKTLSGEPRGKDTPFQQLNGNLVLRNGVASNPDLKVLTPGLTVNGDGDIDLRVLGMNYRVGVIIEGDKSDMPDPACEVNPRFVGIEWPILCRGPLELGAKACRLDNEGLGKVAAKLAGDRIGDKIDEKLGDKVSPELKDAIKGLFKR